MFEAGYAHQSARRRFRHGRACLDYPKASARLRRDWLRTHVGVWRVTHPFTAWMPETSPGMTLMATSDLS
jgi:hypothetical protein